MKNRISLLLLGLVALLLSFCLTACGVDINVVTDDPSADAQTQEDQSWEDSDWDDEDWDDSDWDDEDGNESDPAEEIAEADREAVIPEDGHYTTKEDVALYIHTYGELPDNFISKKEAEKLGWSGGSLEPYAPGMSIGGSRFGNYEGLLPEAAGRTYTECDIDTMGAKSRGAKRIVFSNDGLIYYTGDHYKTFTLLYGEE